MATNNRVVHEGVIKDIVEILTNDETLKRATKFFSAQNKTYIPNVAKFTSNLVLTFPVIVDESVPLSTASLISKAVEHRMVTMLQMLFSAINITNSSDAFDFVSRVHQNLTSDDIISFINKMDSLPLRSNKHESVDIEAINDLMVKCIKEDNIVLNSNLPASLNDSYTVSPDGAVSVHEAVRKSNLSPSQKAHHYDTLMGKFMKRGEDINRLKKDLEDEKNKAAAEKEKIKNTPLYKSDSIKDMRLSSDVKKANEDVPSLMIIKFRTGENNDTISSAVIGVKAKIVYVSQADMIDRIITKNNDNNGLLNFLRATTGEISMIKDFLFAINRAKMDVISTKRDSSPIWKMLERRYIMSKKNWALGNYNGSGTAIAVMVISSETESVLERDYGFKCEPNKLLDVMEAYSVMGFAVTDDVKERVKTLYDDNSNNFEVISYNSLEKEDKTQYKKIINLITGGKE